MPPLPIANPVIQGDIVVDNGYDDDDIADVDEENPNDRDFVVDEEDVDEEDVADNDMYDEAGFSDSFKAALISHFPNIFEKGIYIRIENGTRQILSSNTEQTDRYFQDFNDFVKLTGL